MSDPYPFSQLHVHHSDDMARIIVLRFEGGRIDALDASTGFTLWSSDIGYVKVGRHSKLDNAGRPLIMQKLVCIGSTDRGLYALDRGTGETRWRYDAGTPVVGLPFYFDEIVYVLAWNGGHAVNLCTGQKLWHWKAEDPAWFGFPVNRSIYGADAGKRIVELHSRSGEEIWDIQCKPAYYPPAFDGQNFYFGALDRQVIRLDIANRQLKTVLSTHSNSEIKGTHWDYNLLTQPIVTDRALYVLAENDCVYAYDLHNNSILWSKEIDVPSIVNGFAYVPSNEEESLLLLDPHTGELMDSILTDEELIFAPAIWGGVAFTAGWNTFMALNLKTKAPLWFRRYPKDDIIELFEVG